MDGHSSSSDEECQHEMKIWCSICGTGYCNNEGKCHSINDVGSEQTFREKYPHAPRFKKLNRTTKRNHCHSKDKRPENHRAVCDTCLEMQARRQ
jgi:hypothetical protein